LFIGCKCFDFLCSKALPRLQQKSIPVDYASFMNELALARKPSALRELSNYNLLYIVGQNKLNE